MNSVRERVLAIVSTMVAIDAARIRPKDRLLEELGLDRVAKLQLISQIAEDFLLDVEFGEADRIIDVEGLIDLAELRRQARPK